VTRTQLAQPGSPAVAQSGGGVQYQGAEVAQSVGGVQYRGAGVTDCEAIRSFVTGLSLRTRFLRFFTPASPPSSAVLRGMCGAGRATDALVGTHDGVIVAHAMAADSVSPSGCRMADIGLVVADAWQSRGVGSEILGLLVARAAARGVSVLVMDVLPENRRMLAMISRQWADAAYEFGADSVTARVYLPDAAAAAKGTCGGAALRAA
jgi:GNAT superfamily N-acetyltransferase